MMLRKDYMLAIVIVNYEGRCIFTELAGSWTVVFEFQCCLSMHVSVFLHGDEVYFCNNIICRNSLVGSCCVNMSMLVCMCGVIC